MVTSDGERTQHIVDVLTDAFADLAAADPAAFRRTYRTMAADPFAFLRGTACLFYADLAEREDRWADERTSRVWIQGDLHVENFGTYMDSEGVLVFDVNDYDEAYLGHFTWDQFSPYEADLERRPERRARLSPSWDRAVSAA